MGTFVSKSTEHAVIAESRTLQLDLRLSHSRYENGKIGDRGTVAGGIRISPAAQPTSDYSAAETIQVTVVLWTPKPSTLFLLHWNALAMLGVRQYDRAKSLADS